jgi:anti-anti-sigma factor
VSPTPFEVKNEELEGGVLSFAVRGELDLNTAPALAGPLEEALSNADDASVLIDLSGCEFIDSTGIAMIVRAWQQLGHESNGQGRSRFAICCVNDQVQRLLDITGLESSIPTHSTRNEALAELRG